MSASVLVVGVAVLDFVFQMQHFPRTAEKYRADGAVISGGGNAGNAAVAIARLGGTAHLAARLGHDEIADMILSGLQRENVKIELTRRFEGHRSSFSSIYIDNAGERQIMNYRDTSLSMDAAWLLQSIPKGIKACLADTRWPQGAFAAMQAAKNRGIPGIMDAEAPVMEARDAINTASHVAFSAQGAKDLTGEEDVELAAVKADQILPGTVIVTDGENGAVLVKNKEVQHFPVRRVEAVDTLGAGDVWHGAFALSLARDMNEENAIHFANAAATLKCTRPGGREGAPTQQETLAFLEGQT